jgi:hypothetical protein
MSDTGYTGGMTINNTNAKGTKMKSETKTCECYKCGGSGYIEAFSGIASGICFTCDGTGKVAFRVKKQNKFSPINAMHCRTLDEAQSFRLAEFANRFPTIALTADDEYRIKNGCGNLKQIVANYEMSVS